MNKQKGSAHAIIIICLVTALIGALGFIFWQNFVTKNDDKVSVSEDVSKKKSPSTSENEQPKQDQEYTTKQKISEWMSGSSSVSIQDYMTETINYSIAHSDGIFKDDPKNHAAANITSYLAGHVNPWVSQDYDKISGHDAFIAQAKNDTYFDFSNSYVSLNTGADSEDFAAFKINESGLITDVYVGTVVGF